MERPAEGLEVLERAKNGFKAPFAESGDERLFIFLDHDSPLVKHQDIRVNPLRRNEQRMVIREVGGGRIENFPVLENIRNLWHPIFIDEYAARC